MKIMIAPDSFKGSLGAPEVAHALATGLARALPGAALDLAPVADGGEGTCSTLVHATGGALRRTWVTGPLGERVEATWGVLGDGRTAVVEMAEASGLTLVPLEARDPLRTTTRGTGELVLAAAAAGCTKLILGLGGSATCDGGAGLAQALGYRLLDAAGGDLAGGGGALANLERIDAAGRADLPLEVVAACDVDNPLCGERGAARVYAPQKGADAVAAERLEAGLLRLADVVARDLGRDVRAEPGAGAAGGLGAGLLAFADARLERGVELVLDAMRFDARLAGADLVLTGEGRLDAQTLAGKAPLGVARRAKRAGVPVVAVAGAVSPEAYALHDEGVVALLSIVPGPMPLQAAMSDARALLERAGEQIGRLWSLRRDALD